MNKSSVYLKVYPQRFNLPERKGIWDVAAHPTASSQSFIGLIVFLTTNYKKKSSEKFKNVIFFPLKHHYPLSTA